MRWSVLAAGVAVMLVLGCAPTTDEPASPWPAGSGHDLAATGWLLWGGAGADGVVVDAAGMAWVDGPWQVSRIDPTTGAATTWDAADDPAFASVTDIAPADPQGVWLVAGDTARLFDGERFVMVLDLPPAPTDQESDQPARHDLLQVGGEVWVSGSGGVSRWADGTWTPMGQDTLVSAGPLAVDRDGGIWAGGTIIGPDGTRTDAPVRWDGTSWVTPATGPQTPAGDMRDIAADPTGGVWVASAREGTIQHGVFRYDGTAWTRVGPGGYVGNLSITTGGQVWAQASAGNGVDPSGSSSAARLAADGSWQPYGAEEGAPQGDELASLDLAVSGDVVLLAHDAGLDRSQGEPGSERFVTLWADPSAVVKVPAGASAGSVVAASADEAYLTAQRLGADTNDLNPALLRRRDFEWVQIGPVLPGDTGTSPILATDGAVWAVSVEGLMRVEAGSDHERLVADDVEPWNPPVLAAGAAGSVWLVDGGDVVRIDPDGTRTSIGRPAGVKRLWSLSPVAASGEVVWVAEPSGPVHRWDGTWTTLPAVAGGVQQLAGAPDGSVWALTAEEQHRVVRLTDGAWTQAVVGGRGLAVAPDGAICTIRTEEADVACYDARLAVTSQHAVGAELHALTVAPDGAVWVLGEQVARISPPTS